MKEVSISKEDMVGFLSEHGEEVPEDAEITAVKLTDDAVEFSLEEKEPVG